MIKIKNFRVSKDTIIKTKRQVTDFFSRYLQDSLNIIARIFLSNAISNMHLIPISSMQPHIIQNKNWSLYNDLQGLFWTVPFCHRPLLYLPSLFISLTWLTFLVYARPLFIAVKAALLYSPLQLFLCSNMPHNLFIHLFIYCIFQVD